jgi:hypothetical protein
MSVVIASLIRMTGGNFRLLPRLLTSDRRVLSVNDLRLVSTSVVEAAGGSLVIGPSYNQIRQIILKHYAK